MESRHNLLYLYYLTVTEIGMLECCILNTILWLSRKNQDNRLCLCMWQRGVWRSHVKCAVGTSSRMIYLFYFTDLCLSVVSAVCMLRAFQIILSHTWPLIAFVSRGLRGSGQWPHTGPLEHYGAGGKQTATSRDDSPQCFVDINLCISHWSIITLHCFLFDSFLLKDSFILILHQSNLIRAVLESPQTVP